MFYKPTGIFGKANNHLAVKYQENKRGCPFETPSFFILNSGKSIGHWIFSLKFHLEEGGSPH
jgi:hypothetical protein